MRALTLAVLALTCVAARASNTEDATSTATDDGTSLDAFLRHALPLYRSRSLECVVCQRALAYYDEHLMLALQDIVAEEARVASGRSSEFATRYGRFESVIEEAVPSTCFAGSIATNRTVRLACERMIERNEDAVVDLYFKVGEALRRGEEEELGEALCGADGAMMKGACEDDVARWKVSELEVLEMESSKVSKSDFQPDEQAPGMPLMYKSEPEQTPPKKGHVAKIVASDFYKRVILQRDIDALVYFAYPTKAKEFHEAYEQTHELLAEVLEDSDQLIIGQIDAEKNEIPPPYADMATTPSVLLYRAHKKENPRWIPLRTAAGEFITGESAPTLADVLTMLSKHAKSKKTKAVVDKALVEFTAEQLHSTRAKPDDDEL